MEKFVLWRSGEVRLGVERLGLTVDILSNAVEAGYFSRISRTDNDAPNAAGTYQWNETLRMLREQLAVRGWERSNAGGFPIIVDAKNNVALCVSSGDQFTGIWNKIPSTKNHKGARTADRVESNAQLLLFPEMDADVRFDDRAIPTWFLLFYTDGEEVRSELSLPIFIDGGKINGWRERIILPPISLDGGHNGINAPVAPDFGPEIDVEIRRKA